MFKCAKDKAKGPSIARGQFNGQELERGVLHRAQGRARVVNLLVWRSGPAWSWSLEQFARGKVEMTVRFSAGPERKNG